MGYKIVYQDTGLTKSYMQAPKMRKRKRWIVWACAFSVLIGFLLNLISNQSNQQTVTQKAFSSFTTNLKDGKGIGESFTVFCKEIIASADIS